MTFLNTLFRRPEKELVHPGIDIPQSSPVVLPPVFTNKPFFVFLKTMDDTLEIFLHEQNSTLQVFTRYSEGQENCMVTWHPPLNTPLRDPKKITSVVNFIFSDYPLCSTDQLENKYAGNLAIFRNYSGKADMTAQEEYAARFLFASRFLKGCTLDFMDFLRTTMENVYNTSVMPLKRSYECLPTLMCGYECGIIQLCDYKKKLVELGLPREGWLVTLADVRNQIGERLLPVIQECERYLSSVPVSPFSKKVIETRSRLWEILILHKVLPPKPSDQAQLFFEKFQSLMEFLAIP